MKRNLRRGIALLLCLALCFSLTINVFASNELGISYTAILSQSTVDASDKDQTVNLTIGTSAPVTLDSIEVIVSDASGKLVVGNPSGYPNGGTASYNDKANKLSWMNLGDDNIEDVTTLAVFPITIPANTPAGEYVINVTGIKLSKDWGTTWEDGGSATTTLTVKDTTPAADGYTVAVSMANAKINTGDTAMVKLAISNPNVAYYNAVDMKLTYDANVLSFDKTKSTGLPTDATVTDANGSLRIQFYGENRTDALQLAFTGIAAGESKVKVTEAHVDQFEKATVQDAPAATVTGSATITVGQTYNVTKPEGNIINGASTVKAGEDYIFTLNNGLDGTYMDVKYKVGDGEFKDLMLVDGKYTIPAGEITGDITITAVGKTYNVTKVSTGVDDVNLNGNTATYGTNYTFTLNKADNYAYTVTVTAGGKTVTPALDADGKTYTINGKDITGDVVITVTKETNKAQINFIGSGSADVVKGTSQTAEPGKEFTFTITKEDGYAYTVTAAKADDTAVTVTDNGDGTYTIAGADIAAGDVITVTVEKNLIEAKYTIEVNEFVKLGANAEGKAQSVFLITAKLNGDAKLADGKVLAYGNNAMFQNAERYDGAYAYLVISDKMLNEVKAEAEKTGQITEVEGSAEIFNVNGDVNYTGLVDINDAQLVYNIYNAKYDSFETTTMKMFLAADVNKDREVSALDAAAVVGLIK